jgi:hypothetical protein
VLFVLLQAVLRVQGNQGYSISKGCYKNTRDLGTVDVHAACLAVLPARSTAHALALVITSCQFAVLLLLQEACGSAMPPLCATPLDDDVAAEEQRMRGLLAQRIGEEQHQL